MQEENREVPGERVRETKARGGQTRDPAFWAPQNKATRFLASFTDHHRAFMERSLSAGESTTSASRLAKSCDNTDMHMPKGKRIFALPSSSKRVKRTGPYGEYDEIIVRLSDSKSPQNGWRPRLALASEPKDEPIFALPKHQRYEYYKYYGYGGIGATTSWAYNPCKRPLPLDKQHQGEGGISC